MSTTPNRSIDSFDTWLDTFVAGTSTPASRAAAGSTDAAVCDAARQFHGLAQRAERTPPDTSFTTTWEDFIGTQGICTTADLVPARTATASPLVTTRTRCHSDEGGIFRHRVNTSRWNRATNALLAAALILVIGAGIWRATDGFPSNDNRSQLAVLTAQDGTPAAAFSNPTSWGGNNGHTSFTPDATFDSSNLATTTLIDDARYTIQAMQASGNTLVQIGSFFEGEYGDAITSVMWATDLRTGKVIWMLQQTFASGFAIAGGTVYAVHIAQNVGQPFHSMMAISLESGERRDFAETQLPVIESGERIGPIIVGNTVFVADSIGTTFALDASTGEVLWKTEGDRGDTPLPSLEGPGATGGALTSDGESIYVVTGANQVRKLHLTTGEILFDAGDLLESDDSGYFESGIFGVTIHVTDTRLVARVTGFPTNSSDAGQVQMIPETILLVDKDNGSVKWSHPTTDIAGELAIASDQLFVPIRLHEADPIDLAIIHLGGGGTTVIEDVSTARTMVITATGASGSEIILIDSDGRIEIGTYVFRGMEEWTIDFEIPTIRSVPGEGQAPPAVVSQGVAYVANEAGRIIAITPAP